MSSDAETKFQAAKKLIDEFKSDRPFDIFKKFEKPSMDEQYSGDMGDWISQIRQDKTAIKSEFEKKDEEIRKLKTEILQKKNITEAERSMGRYLKKIVIFIFIIMVLCVVIFMYSKLRESEKFSSFTTGNLITYRESPYVADNALLEETRKNNGVSQAFTGYVGRFPSVGNNVFQV